MSDKDFAESVMLMCSEEEAELRDKIDRVLSRMAATKDKYYTSAITYEQYIVESNEEYAELVELRRKLKKVMHIKKYLEEKWLKNEH